MRYFGIKPPNKGSIWWIATSESACWRQFFQYPNHNDDRNFHRLPMAEAIEAYQAIGYKCVELEIKEKECQN